MKKYSQNLGLLNLEVHNTFTEVEFYNNNLIIGTVTNNDDLKIFWNEKYVNKWIGIFFIPEKKISKKELIKN